MTSSRALGLSLLLWPAWLGAAQVQVRSLAIEVLADTAATAPPGGHPGFWATILTPGGENLLYYDPDDPTLGTSRMVFDLDGNPYDLQSANPVVLPVTASGTGLGATITMAKSVGSWDIGATYTIVNNPHTGTGADTVMVQGWVKNGSSVALSVGLRMLLDDEIINSNFDGAPLSIDNGMTTINANTLFEAATAAVPSDWWCYDQVTDPTLVARGVTWGNQFGPAATQPDAEEFCQWPDVAAVDYYQPDPNPGQAFPPPSSSDTCVVLWYTNTGQAQGGAYQAAPGQTLVFTTYYGLNQGALLATLTPNPNFSPSPTPSASPTRSPTFTVSPTFSASPTISPTFTVTRTFTVSPTFTASPTVTPTFTVSPSFTASPTLTQTFTISPSFTASPTLTATDSYTVSPTLTSSPTASLSPTVTPCFTVSPSFTVSPTPSASPSATPTVPPNLVLSPRLPNPDPGGPAGIYLPYVLSCDAQVRIRVFNISGEKVRDLAPYQGLLGANEEHWDALNDFGQSVASGVYLAHYVATRGSQSADCWVKMALVR
jgi:hypothetical protein